MSDSNFNKNLKQTIAVFIILFIYVPCYCQTNKIDEITASFKHFSQTHLTEKIFVHTDRSYYLCGDILWFKIYLASDADNKLLSVSKIAYIEILNTLHQPVLQGKIAMESGTGSGSFDLPVSLASGNYELRAYTNWMKNDSPDYYFKKIITIVNTTENPDTVLLHSHIRYEAQILPEGGNLVNGLTSTVAFKVNDNYGKGTDCEGVVIDQSKDTVAHFQSSQFGMGQFLMTPQNGKTYTAIITIKNSAVIIRKLPDAYDKGYVMHVGKIENDQVKISVQSSSNISSTNLYLVSETRSHINFAKEMAVENNQAILVFNTDELADGIAQITLLNQYLQPLCERLWFKRPKNKMLIQVKPQKLNYNRRNKIDIDLQTSSQSGDSLEANLSVSVYRQDSLHRSTHEDLFSYLWLSSDCRGYIEDPQYYFKSDNSQTNTDLDNLLLTQGWRKFDWKNAIQPAAFAFNYIPENYGHIITGRITSDLTGKPVEGILVYLSVPGKRIQLYGCRSNLQGLIHFDMNDFYGSTQVVLQTNTTTDSTYHLEIFSPYSEKYSGNVLPALQLEEKSSNELQAANLHMKIETAYHEKERQQLQPLLIDTLPFYYKAAKIYLLDNYTRFTTMEEVLREYVSEVNVNRRSKKYRLFVLDQEAYDLHASQTAPNFFGEDPLILLDGVPVFNADNIVAYDPLKVKKLEIVSARYHWGPIIADGITSFTTYKANLDGYTLNPHDLVVDYDGLQQQRIFYSPDYSTADATNSRLPDFRELLYWSPQIITNKSGKAHLTFYSGDLPGKYLVEIVGISAVGVAGALSVLLNIDK